MVKLPGALTKGGHKPATRPLPFLPWIFNRTVGSEITGSWYCEISLPWAIFGLRSKSVCLPLRWSLPHHLEPSCDHSFASLFTGERWEKSNLITSWSLTARWSPPCLRDKRGFKIPPRSFLWLACWPFKSLSGGQITCLHTLSLCL